MIKTIQTKAASHVCALFFLLCGNAGIARADKTAAHAKSKTMPVDAKTQQARQTVQAVYNLQAAAMMRKDVKGFLAPFTPDYQDLKYGNRLYTLANLRQQLPGLIAKYPPGFQFKITIQKFKLERTGANATANYHLQVVRTDAEHRKQELWVSDTVSEDKWIKEGQEWRLQGSRETKFTRRKMPLASYHPQTPIPHNTKGAKR